jgi:hypothetical protein
VILNSEQLAIIRHRRLWVNEYRLREWVYDLLATLEDASTQLTEARAEIARLELEVAGWRAAADRNRPKFVNSENKMCYCGGVGCLSCCGNE